MELKTKFSPEKAAPAHEGTILAAPVIPEGMNEPFGHAWGYLAGPGEMDRHRHNKEEVFFVFKGKGAVEIDGTEIPVEPGDVVRIPPNALHSMINREDEELLWATLWWGEIGE